MKITTSKRYILKYTNSYDQKTTYEISATKYEETSIGNFGDGIVKFYLDNEEIANFPKKDLIIMDKSKVKVIREEQVKGLL